MKLKTIKYSPEAVSEYLSKRLKPEGPTTEKGSKSKSGSPSTRHKRDRIGNERPLSPYQIGQWLNELDELIAEKSDLLKQIASDEYLLGMPRQSVTQDEVLSVLDDLKHVEDVNLRALIGRIDPKQVFRTSIEQAQRRLVETTSRIAQLIANEEIAQAYRESTAKKIGIIRSARNVESLHSIIEKAELAKMALLARRNDENASLTKADSESMKNMT